MGGVRKSEGWTADTARKRPERPWSATTDNNGSVKAVSPRLTVCSVYQMHCVIAVSTAMLGQSTSFNTLDNRRGYSQRGGAN